MGLRGDPRVLLAAGLLGMPILACGKSDVAIRMFMARPSRGTPLYVFMAFRASFRRSNTTSAVPIESAKIKINLLELKINHGD